MAQIRFSNLVNDIRGAVGGVTFSRSASGAMVSARKSPRRAFRNKPSAKVNYISSLSQQWRLLTQSQRDAWALAATSVPESNRLGLPRSPTGFELFVKVNHARLLVGLPVADTLSSLSGPRVTFVSSFVRSFATSRWIYLFRFAQQIPGYFLVYMSKPVLPGHKRPNSAKFKFVTSQPYILEQNREVTSARYAEVFPTGWNVPGATYYVRILYVTTDPGLPIYLGTLQDTAP